MDFNLNRTGSIWDRSQRINTNDNWDKIEGVIKDRGVEILSDVAFLDWLDENNFKPKGAVQTFGELPNNPELKELRGVISENSVYVFNGENWVKQSELNFDGLNDVKNTIQKNESKVRNNLYVFNKSKKPVVTIIDDDGYTGFYNILKPMCDVRGIKVDSAIVTAEIGKPSRMSAAQIQEIYNDGFGILSHTHTHVNLEQQNEIDLNFELEESKRVLNDLGIEPPALVYPYNATSEIASDYVRRHYPVGIGRIHQPNEHLNLPPLRNAELTRRNLGYGDVQALEGDKTKFENSLENAKFYIDEAIDKGSWLIFVTHITQSTESQRQIVEQALDYLVQKRDAGLLDVLITSDALERFGNKNDIGTHHLMPEANNVEGDLKYEIVSYDDRRYNGTEYITYRSRAGTANSPNNNLPLRDYKKGITLTVYSASYNTGFPGTGGILETIRNYDDTRSFQYWHSQNGNIYKRLWKNDSWGTFKKMTVDVIDIPSTLLEFPVIEARKSHTITIDVAQGENYPPITNNDTVVMNPRTSLNPGFIWNCTIPSHGKVSITVHNLNENSGSSGQTTWVGKVFK